MILGIDPGPEQSAWVSYDGCAGVVVHSRICRNEDFIKILRHPVRTIGDHLAIEMVESFGMSVGRSVFETVYWIGRFVEAWGPKHTRIYRKDIKLHLCQSLRAKDANIRQALIDKLGPPGTKKNPGKTYGVSKDVWSALAVAVTCHELGTVPG